MKPDDNILPDAFLEYLNGLERATNALEADTRTRAANATAEAFEECVTDVYQDAQHLLLSKHRDYGPLNIANAPGGALNGLRVRLHDKLARINHLIDNGATPENESLADSFIDTMNYCAIALLVLREEWPNV